MITTGEMTLRQINKGESELTGKISNQIKFRENKSASKKNKGKRQTKKMVKPTRNYTNNNAAAAGGQPGGLRTHPSKPFVKGKGGPRKFGGPNA